MTRYFFGASHEEYSPDDLLRHAVAAERAGFDGISARRPSGSRAQPPDHFTDDWHLPQEMYEHGEREVSDEEFAQNIISGSDPESFVERLRELEQLGGTVITLQNNSGANAERAIELLGREVLPALRGARV